MKRWLPFPILPLLFLAMWLALNQTFAISHVLIGAALAFGATRAYRRLQAPMASARRVRVAMELLGAVLWDVVRSNVAVARIVLGLGARDTTPGFLDISLSLRNPAGLAALACIITATPGTAWAGYDSARGILTLHILDLVDEATWIEIIKSRYERRLLEIFE